MSLFCYYKSFLLLSLKYNLPFDIARNIFSFLKDDYIDKINKKNIQHKIKKFIVFNNNSNYKNSMNNVFCLHTDEIIGANINTFINFISKELKKNNINLTFSHTCCNGKGIVFQKKKNKKF